MSRDTGRHYSDTYHLNGEKNRDPRSDRSRQSKFQNAPEWQLLARASYAPQAVSGANSNNLAEVPSCRDARATDDQLLTGAALRFQHAVNRVSLSDVLSRTSVYPFQSYNWVSKAVNKWAIFQKTFVRLPITNCSEASQRHVFLLLIL